MSSKLHPFWWFVRPAEVTLFSDGFEDCGFAEWSGTFGSNLSCSNLVKRTGSYALRYNGATFESGYAYKNLGSLAGYSVLKAVVYFYPDTLSYAQNGQKQEFIFLGSTDIGLVDVALGVKRVAGVLYYYLQYDQTSEVVTDLQPTLDNWVKVELRVFLDSSSGYVELYIGDVLKATSGTYNTRTYVECLGVGHSPRELYAVGNTVKIYVDDVEVKATT